MSYLIVCINVAKNGYQNCMCYDDITLCAHNTLTILGSIVTGLMGSLKEVHESLILAPMTFSSKS